MDALLYWYRLRCDQQRNLKLTLDLKINRAYFQKLKGDQRQTLIYNLVNFFHVRKGLITNYLRRKTDLVGINEIRQKGAGL